jgi:DNA-binding MarR family transcriptional regulator
LSQNCAMAGIGEEIKQKEFTSEYNKLVVNILFTSSWINSEHNQIFKAYGITTQQFNVLRILRGQLPNAASVNLLKDRMIDKMSNVSRIIDKLKAKDLVTRKLCKHDRRQVDVKITEKGEKLLAELDVQMAEYGKKLVNISPEEAAAVSDVLDRWRG